MRSPVTPTPRPALRRETLRESLPAALASLRGRRAGDIPPGDIDDYVALRWLEWHGGTLRATVVGENIRQQLVHRTAAAVSGAAATR